jgi:hemerythrin
MMGNPRGRMPFFVWNPSYDLGVDAVDADHRRLFEILRRLHDGIAAGWAAPAVGEVLRELAEQARVHVVHEEDLLEAAGCPDLERQRADHRGFLEHLADLQTSAGSLGVDAAVRLRDLLLEHILGGDRSYAGWLARVAPEAVADWARRRAAAALPRR